MSESSSKTVWLDGLACSIESTLDIIGDRWSLLVLRQALEYQMTRFSEFETTLGIAPNILTDRLEKIVSAGVFERRVYQEPGLRPRYSYHATAAGEKLKLVLAALQQWGDEYRTPPEGPTVLRRSEDRDLPVRVAFVDEANDVVPLGNMVFVTAPVYLERAAEKGGS